MKVKFLTPVQHDAHSYRVGESANLPDAAARQLIDCGAVEPLDAAAEKAAAKAEAHAKAEAQAEAQAKAEAAEKAAADAAQAGAANGDTLV